MSEQRAGGSNRPVAAVQGCGEKRQQGGRASLLQWGSAMGTTVRGPVLAPGEQTRWLCAVPGLPGREDAVEVAAKVTK